MDKAIAQLRRLNIAAGVLHLVSFVAILLLSNNFSLPVQATYLTDAPGRGMFTESINLFNINTGYMVAAFMALSAFFHFFVASLALDAISRRLQWHLHVNKFEHEFERLP